MAMTLNPSSGRSKSGGRARESRDTRAALLRAATRLFAERGFDGTSLREVAQAAEVNLAMVSYHFSGKEGLYSACIEAYGQAELHAAKTHLSGPISKDTFKKQLIAYCEEVILLHLAQPDVAQIIYRELDRGTPTTERIFRETFIEGIETIVRQMKAGQKAGIIRKDTDPLNIAGLLFGAVHHALRMRLQVQKFLTKDMNSATFRKKLVSDWVDITLSGALISEVPKTRSRISRNGKHR